MESFIFESDPEFRDCFDTFSTSTSYFGFWGLGFHKCRYQILIRSHQFLLMTLSSIFRESILLIPNVEFTLWITNLGRIKTRWQFWNERHESPYIDTLMLIFSTTSGQVLNFKALSKLEERSWNFNSLRAVRNEISRSMSNPELNYSFSSKYMYTVFPSLEFEQFPIKYTSTDYEIILKHGLPKLLLKIFLLIFNICDSCC